MRKAVFAFLLAVLCLAAIACGPAIYKAYGKSGAIYSAPDLCQAAAKCAKAGEEACFYYQSDTFHCREKETKK